ncbi:sigma-54 dependent transcriptional regulator [Methyloceanibacter sp.]|uniref:sigma-54-dependent transcriptional regulator n=1 Tax=Methyloceanibacter sp. TaxID=1965321 RepID=UPI002088BD50|nr:sigma-54 dependent transcriptional regulator [Methyloceanibacter sp.]GFO83381.1 MAG: sigma-54-dependent Fis family transcriptional regulator [Methyloceanibacter sp.]HML93639.1 sigma-54 dependent transcriptional regulator [Methyloceanibacter sp.]
MPSCVLVVDDDPTQRRILEETTKRFGYTVQTAEGGEAALAALQAGNAGEIALVLLDLVMPETDGMSVLAAMRSLPRRPPVIVQTANGSIDAAIGAMRAGAVDFVVKPVSPERLEVSIKNALKIEALAGEINRMKATATGELDFDDLIAGSETMARVIEVGRRAAASNIPVLIEGESGVGKELIARAIQGESARKAKPFVTVNCGAIPETLVESILFGHEKGAFTGATEKRAGKFVEADGGTLFLDEIGELPLDAQVKLLRALQEGEIDPVGGKQPVKVNIRLISATNQNLIKLVQEGRFREDLYYRLNVFPIWVPPLRERLDDVPELIRHFTARFAAEEGKRIDGVDADATAMLQRYSWPGNIRQLENTVFRAVVLADSPMLTVDEFPQIAAHVEGYAVTVPPAPAPKDPMPRIDGPVMLGQSAGAAETVHIPSANGKDALGIPALGANGDIRSLEAVEADMIRLAFGRYRGRMTEIAKRLGIGRSTLYRKMREIGLEARPN